MSDDLFAFTPTTYTSTLSHHPQWEVVIDHHGHPRDVSYSPTRNAGCLKVRFAYEKMPAYGAKRPIGVKGVEVSEPYKEAGWKLRRDYFREWHASEKSNGGKAKAVEAWNLWQDFHARCHDDRRPTVQGKTFPEKYLPPEENALRKRWKDNQARREWDPEAVSA